MGYICGSLQAAAATAKFNQLISHLIQIQFLFHNLLIWS